MATPSEKTRKRPGLLTRYVGGLLGEDVEGMSENDLRKFRQEALLSAISGLGGGVGLLGGLGQMAQRKTARQEMEEQQRRLGAARQAEGQISGRLYGGLPTSTAPGAMGADDGLTGVSVQSPYRRDPTGAAALAGTAAGLDAMKINPMLADMLKNQVGQQVVGGSIYDRQTGQFINPPQEQGPRKRVGSEDLGDRVITYFDDGTTSINMKGVAPKSESAGRPDLSKDERDRVYSARDTIRASGEVIAGLTEARRLSDIAFQGPLAGVRAAGGAALPGQLEPAGAQETIEFDTLIKQQVLPQLKIIFGGNPTEGERKILLDLQGSSSMPRAVRNRILDRAIEAANRRLQSSQIEVEEIISGTYFTTQSMSGRPTPTAPDSATSAPAAPTAPQMRFIWLNNKLVPAK